MIEGTSNDDTLTGTSGDDTIDGLAGNDSIDGGDGNDILAGGPGADTLNGGAGDDTLYSGSISPPWQLPFFSNNPDYVPPVLDHGSEIDTLNGGPGIDRIYAGYGDIVDGGADLADLLISLAGASSGVTVDFRALDNGGTLTVGGGLIQNIRSVLWIEGTNFDDTITGSDQGDGSGCTYAPMFGLGGNDHLIAGKNTGNIYGGDGNDTIEVHQSYTGVGENGVYYGDAGDDVITVTGEGVGYPFAAVFGGDGNDTITTAGTAHGDAGNDIINIATNLQYQSYAYGDAGDDTINDSAATDFLYGGDGNDTLIGNGGSDTLTGGAGNDRFLDTSTHLNGDTITDFSVGDSIVITDATLAGFSFSLSGNTLSWNGGSLTLSNVPGGHLITSAAPGGGVQLTIETHDPLNDFNGDGRSDILWRSDSGQLSDWLGTASGGFANNDVNAFAGVPTSWTVTGTGDFNGDGKDDLLWRSDSGQLSDWLGQAIGGFANNDANAFIGVAVSWHVAGVGDFNGDGKDDILWRSDSGQLSDWLGTSTGGFANNDAHAASGVPTSWKVAGVGDFNGDGKADILWRSDTGQLSDWLGTSTGGFANDDANASIGVPTSWHVIGVGDFNGDGRDDILWRSDSGQLSDWLGQANGGFVANDGNAMTGVPLSWHVSAIGDYNGDGRDDILWRSDSGQLSDWLAQANGGFASNDANAMTGVPLSWHAHSPDIFWL